MSSVLDDHTCSVLSEVISIFRLYSVLQRYDFPFKGFDVEAEEASRMPYEGNHHTIAELLRPVMEPLVGSWPYKSHSRNLLDYRRQLAMWQVVGSPEYLSKREFEQITKLPAGVVAIYEAANKNLGNP